MEGATLQDFGFAGLGFGIQGLGFRAQGLGFRAQGLGFGVGSLSFSSWEFRGWGFGDEAVATCNIEA